MSPNSRRTFGFAAALAVVITAGFGLLALWPRPPAPPQPVNLVTSEWEPYVVPDRDDGGPLGALVSRVFQSAGYLPRMEFTSWPDAQERVASQSAVAAFPFIETAERRQRFHVSDPVTTFRYALFHRADGEVTEERLARWSMGEGEDLGWVLGAIDGYELWESLDEIASVDRWYESQQAAFAALAAGEIDLLPEGDIVGFDFLNSTEVGIDASTIVASETRDGVLADSEQELRILAPRNPEGARLIRRVNAAIETLTDQGVIDDYGAQLAELDRDSTTGTRVVTVGMTTATDATGRSFMLAPGTSATVTDWPDSFVDGFGGGLDSLPARATVEVKIGNGPSRGRLLRVDVEAIRIDEVEAP